jgi:ABC-type multidrug transport system fused ATPase/permease subunit
LQFFYPAVLDSLATGKNALRRISSYLTSEELIPYVKYVPPTDGGRIEMKHGSFLWSTSQQPKEGEVAPPEVPALCDVNLQVNPGEVVAVVGGVGSGKSALLKGILGELAPVPKILVEQKAGIPNSTQTDQLMSRPEVTIHGHIGYCSQEAWLPKGTLRDSVLFGRDYDEERYESALYDAGLDEDMVSGTLRSDMDVGEKGSNLSGGQRARVALARALYGAEDTKVFLLDDVLAALDARVGAIVFERVSKRLRIANAATLLVTNDPSIPRRCDRVVLMGPTGGSSANNACSTIIDCGTYDELIRRGHNLRSFPAIERDGEIAGEHSETTHSFDGEVEIEARPKRADTIRVVGGYKVMTNDTDCSCHADPDTVQVDVQNNADLMAERVIRLDQDAMESLNAMEEMNVDIVDGVMINDTAAISSSSVSPSEKSKDVGLVSTDDKMASEAVPFSAYVGYLRAVRNPTYIIAMLASFGIVNGAQFFQQYTVSKWTDLAATSTAAAMGGKYLSNLVHAAFVVSFFLFCRSYLTMLVGRRASAFYHNKMLSSVFRAPMSFFDATPSGQILSRFGKELETVDKSLPETIASVLFCALQIGSSGAALAGAISPVMLLPLTVASNLYFNIMRRFRPAARDMKRNEQRTRSPIFTNFAEALRGTEVIRSIPGATTSWSHKHRSLSDKNLAVYSTVKALDRWLSVNLEAIGNLIVFITALSSLLLARGGRLASGSAGWGLTQSLSITGTGFVVILFVAVAVESSQIILCLTVLIVFYSPQNLLFAQD